MQGQDPQSHRSFDVTLRSDLTAVDPAFATEVFSAIIKSNKQRLAAQDNWQCACMEEYGELSRLLDRSQLQDSITVRNVLRTRRLAELLIDAEGELIAAKLHQQIATWQRCLYSLGPDRQYDALRHEHILSVLCTLRDDKEAVRLLRKIGKPHSHKGAEQIIRDTLGLAANTPVGDAEARRAALAAWLCYLRQNVGSCFGTAPAILLHTEQPYAFLIDLNELLATGRLQRIFAGIEYSAPLSATWGAGDLRRPCVIPRADRFGSQELWLSPGLIDALTAASLFDATMPFKAKALKLRAMLARLLLEWEGETQYVLVSAEEILRRLLLRHLGLTARELHDYEQRPREMIQSSLLMQTPQAAIHSGGLGAVCARFYVLFETACKAFNLLTDNALLRSWEFTLASFAETKATFSRWNFYASLGLNPDDAGGIGPCIYQAVQERLNELTARVHEYQEQYDQIYGQVRYLEVRIRTANEQEGQWLRPELASLVNEFRTIQQMRDSTQQKAQNVSELYQLLVDVYDNAFPRYFQEVYDADLHEVNVGPYDDSPAGFRLVYKYGRSNTSQWTPIRQANEFIEALVNFFIATETEIASHPVLENLQDILTPIVSTIVTHVRTPLFLESALQRMAAAHHAPLIANPLEHLDQVEKKPWVYTSGGSMATLVSCYFGLENAPTTVTRWVETPLELAVFFIDTLKQMPQATKDAWKKKQRAALLMHSPTHAFAARPTFAVLQEALAQEAFTYTWVRDDIVTPLQRFVSNVVLNEAKMEYLVQHLAEKVPINYRLRFNQVFKNLYGTMDPTQFRQHLVETIESDSGLLLKGRPVLDTDTIDSTLYSMIPLISAPQLPECIQILLSDLPGVDATTVTTALSHLKRFMPSYGSNAIIDAKALQNIARALLSLTWRTVHSPHDYHLLIASRAQKNSLAMPQPLLFADTNWVRDYFAFTVNPGTGLFELWRLDYTGTTGAPMSAWRHWLDGSRQDPPWGIYNRPHEYYLRIH